MPRGPVLDDDEPLHNAEPAGRRHLRLRRPRRAHRHRREGRDKAHEAQVLLVGGGDEPARGQVPQEAQPRQRRQAQGGHPGERRALLRLRVHEGEPLSAHEGQVSPYAGAVDIIWIFDMGVKWFGLLDARR